MLTDAIEVQQQLVDDARKRAERSARREGAGECAQGTGEKVGPRATAPYDSRAAASARCSVAAPTPNSAATCRFAVAVLSHVVATE